MHFFMQQILFHLFFAIESISAAKFSLEIISPGNYRLLSVSSMPITAPALDLAVEELNKKHSNILSTRLTFLYDTSFVSCEDLVGGVDALVGNYYYRRNTSTDATVFIYPGCQMDTISVARLAAAWHQLAIITSYTNPVFRDRRVYPNVIQAGPINARTLIEVIHGFIRKFNWNIVFIVGDKAGNGFSFATTGSALLESRLREDSRTLVYSLLVDSSVNSPFEAVLSRIKNRARIISFWGHALNLRKFMIIANGMNMTGDEYVYIFLDPYEYSTSLFGNVTWQNNDSYDEVALAAYQALFVVVPASSLAQNGSNARSSLMTSLMERSRLDYNYTYSANDVPSPIVLGMVVSVEIVGQLIAKHLGGQIVGSEFLLDHSRTEGLTSLICDHTFNTSVGKLSFDEYGERVIQYEIRQLDSASRAFKAVLQEKFRNPGKFEEFDNIVWRSGSPPVDSPLCGFAGPCAQLNGNGMTTVAVCGALAVLLFFGLGFFLTCRILLRKSLQQNELCNIRYFDVTSELSFAVT